MGQEYLFTWICAKLFSQKNYTVFVTISKDENHYELRESFKKISGVHTITLDDTIDTFEYQLLLSTEGKKVDIVVNCQSGEAHLHASFRCVKYFGNFFDIHTNNSKENIEIGMFPFGESVTMRCIPSGTSYIKKLSSSDKKEIQELVQEGIDSGLVVPLSISKILSGKSCNPSLINPNKNIIKCISPEKQAKMKKLDWKFNEEYLYLIIGSSHKDSWLHLFMWLSEKGCKKFFIGVENTTEEVEILDRLAAIKKQNNLLISIISPQELNSLEGTKKLMKKAENVAPIGSIFFISLDDAGEKIRNTDLVLQQHCLPVPIISLFSGGLQELEARKSKGYPGCVLHCDIAETSSIIENALNDLTQSYNLDNCPVLFQISEIWSKDQENTVLSFTDYLPTNLKELEKFANSYNEEVTFFEHTSLSPRHREIKGIYPVFVFSVVCSRKLETVLKNLLYPVFCASFNRCDLSPQEVANKLFQELNAIHPSGTVYLLSESWNINLVLELSNLIRSAGREYRIFSIEGYPEEWTRYIKSLGTPFSSDFDNSILKELFNLNQANFSNLSSMKTFNQKVEHCLKKFDNNDLNLNHVITSLNLIKYQLSLASQIGIKNEALQYVTLITRKRSNYFNVKLSISSDFIVINQKDYELFLKNPELKKRINENVAF